MSKKKWMVTCTALVVALVAGCAAWIATAQSYAFDEKRVDIPVTNGLTDGGGTPDAGTGGRLQAVLTTPRDSGAKHPLVIFVHGDGPATASRDDAYKPIWESLSDAGFATLSWDKAGVNGAPGDWLAQSLADRGAEVGAALDWARTRPDIDADRIGAWGVSQAGWVLPAISARRGDLKFLMIVGGAVDWLRQGEFNTRAELAADGASDADRRAALDRRARNVAMFERGAPYSEYLASGVDAEPMTRARYGFVMRNFHTDVTSDLDRISSPTLLVLGSADRNVDVVESARVYRERVRSDLLTVRMFDGASHSLTRDDIEYRPDDIGVIARAVFAPRSIYAPGYLDALAAFATAHGSTA
ncbi:alpha/beta hydrolase family protein [Gordonia spumicola]|nr:CocE/NonD family hydrolase [Gordonia spumicola]